MKGSKRTIPADFHHVGWSGYIYIYVHAKIAKHKHRSMGVCTTGQVGGTLWVLGTYILLQTLPGRWLLGDIHVNYLCRILLGSNQRQVSRRLDLIVFSVESSNTIHESK